MTLSGTSVIFSVMEWLAKRIAGVVWRPTPVLDVQVPRIELLRQELIRATGHNNLQVIVGGSHALSICTGRKFPVSDIDIYLPTIDADGRPSHQIASMNISSEQRLIERVYECGETSTVRYATKTDVDNGVFDEYIIGTVDLVFKDILLQFVFVNLSPHLLATWYNRTSDLPMYLTYSGPDKIRVCYKSWCQALRTCKDGIIDSIDSATRIEKYRAKGFTVVESPICYCTLSAI